MSAVIGERDERLLPCVVSVGGVRFGRGSPVSLVWECLERQLALAAAGESLGVARREEIAARLARAMA